MAQSNAESPPPEINTFFPINKSGSLTINSTPFLSNCVKFLIIGFLGSKLPKPPAIITTGAICSVPSLVVTIKHPSFCFFIFSALSPRVKPGLKGLACSIKLSTSSPAKTVG